MIRRWSLGVALRTVAIAAVCWWGAPSTVAAAEQLVYAVTTGQAGRFPRVEKTDIFALDPHDGQPHKVFSDEGLDFLLVTSGERVMTSMGGKVFAAGHPRASYSSGLPTYPASVYEISTDGSNRARKLFDLEGENGVSNYRDLFVSPSGDRLGHINSLGGKWFLFIHDTATGQRLLQLDLTPIALDCFVRSIGWLPDGRRLFFTLETGDVHTTSDASYGRAGSYLMPDAGGSPLRVAADVTDHPERAGYQPVSDMPPTLLGQRQDGSYVVLEFQWKEGRSAGARAEGFIYATPGTGAGRRDLVSGVDVRIGSGYLARSGDLLAFVASGGSRRAGSALLEDGEVHVVSTGGGEHWTVLSFTSTLLSVPSTELIGWIDRE